MIKSNFTSDNRRIYGSGFVWAANARPKALTQLDRWYAFGILYHRSSSYMRQTLAEIFFDNMIKIISYNESFKEQTINLLLSVLEDELGYKGKKRPDLHNIPKVYQKDSMGNFWLAVDKDKVIGTIGLENYGKNRSMIKRMCVKKEYRRNGIGQKLLNVLLDYAKNSGLKTVYCTTMYEFDAAKKLYKKNNFVEIKELPEDLAMPGEDIYLKLKL